MEFSKKLIFIILITWIISLIVVAIGKIFKVELEFIMNYTQIAMTSSVIAYLTKAGMENYNKIKLQNTTPTPLSSTTQEIVNNINSNTNNQV